MVNHFEGSEELTTKAGLCRNIPQLAWLVDMDGASFFPRCYNMSDPTDFDHFLLDFKCTAAECFVRKLVYCRDCLSDCAPLDAAVRTHEFDLAVDTLRGVASQISGDESLVDTFGLGLRLHGSDAQWAALFEMHRQLIGLARSGGWPDYARVPVPAAQADAIWAEVDALLAVFDRSVALQSSLNVLENVWVVKPACSSKGVGVRCHNVLAEILSGRHAGHVVQKYVERPLLLPSGHKFDIRQWVLVSSFAPLTVWLYDKCLLRSAAEPYSLFDLDNRFAHLCNHSVNKTHKAFDGGGSGDSAVGRAALAGVHVNGVDELMFSSECFSDEFDARYGANQWRAVVDQVAALVSNTLRSAEHTIRARASSFELYGFDVILDEARKPWLIEVNFSPDLSHSTAVKVPLVAQMVADLFKVVLDVPADDAADTGGWSRIYVGEAVQGFDGVASDRLLCIDGKKLTKRCRDFERAAEGFRDHQVAVTLQRGVRTLLARAALARARAATAALQACARALLARAAFGGARRAARTLQAVVRRAAARSVLADGRAAARIQAAVRRMVAAHALRLGVAARRVQAAARGAAARRAAGRRRAVRYSRSGL